MKPSHLTTPRTLADCTFTYGYTTSTINRPSFGEFVVQAAIGLMMMAGVLAWAFGYWG